MWLLEGLAELIAPTRCAGCEYPGALLCRTCLPAIPGACAQGPCPRCAAPYGVFVCTECWSRELPFEAAIALGELDGALARAVVLHKDAGERRLGPLLGSMLAELTQQAWPGWPDAVCWVPATDAAKARRGFDHARSLAEPISRAFSVPSVALLARSGARDQRALGRVERAINSAGTFRATGCAPANVLLVDDVLTTGATVEAATQALLEGGAHAVRVAVIARAW